MSYVRSMNIVGTGTAVDTTTTPSRSDRAAIWIGSGWAAYVGPSLHLAHHSGAVSCLGLGLDDTLTVEVAGSPAVTTRSVLIPAGIRHRVTAAATRVAFVYLDPATASHDGCRTRMTCHPVPTCPIRTEHEAESAMIALAVAGSGTELRAAATGLADATHLDRRIIDVLRIIHRPGGADIPTAGLAQHVALSPARFRRLFGETTGVGLRCYRRWARMMIVGAVLTAGGDLTRAAADAGFATPSHLSLAFRRMFGLPPSRLLGSDVSIHVVGTT